MGIAETHLAKPRRTIPHDRHDEPGARWRRGRIQGRHVVSGWCKSAGTLFCIAANHLIIADTGELGPLDVQIAKSDEIWERSSGLVVESAFEKLQQESFKLFFNYLMEIKEQAGRTRSPRKKAGSSRLKVVRRRVPRRPKQEGGEQEAA
jgi:hypothetical protein